MVITLRTRERLERPTRRRHSAQVRRTTQTAYRCLSTSEHTLQSPTPNWGSNGWPSIAIDPPTVATLQPMRGQPLTYADLAGDAAGPGPGTPPAGGSRFRGFCPPPGLLTGTTPQSWITTDVSHPRRSPNRAPRRPAVRRTRRFTESAGTRRAGRPGAGPTICCCVTADAAFAWLALVFPATRREGPGLGRRTGGRVGRAAHRSRHTCWGGPVTEPTSPPCRCRWRRREPANRIDAANRPGVRHAEGGRPVVVTTSGCGRV